MHNKVSSDSAVSGTCCFRRKDMPWGASSSDQCRCNVDWAHISRMPRALLNHCVSSRHRGEQCASGHGRLAPSAAMPINMVIYHLAWTATSRHDGMSQIKCIVRFDDEGRVMPLLTIGDYSLPTSSLLSMAVTCPRSTPSSSGRPLHHYSVTKHPASGGWCSLGPEDSRSCALPDRGAQQASMTSFEDRDAQILGFRLTRIRAFPGVHSTTTSKRYPSRRSDIKRELSFAAGPQRRRCG